MLSAVQELSYRQRVGVVALVDLFIFLLVRFVVTRLQPGKQRLVAAAPALAATCVLPLLFSRQHEVVTLVAVAFLHVWLANFKVKMRLLHE